MNAVIVLAFLVATAVAAPQLSSPQFIAVLQRTDVRDPHGQFAHSYTGADGTHVSETGALQPTPDKLDNVLVKNGFYRFYSPEGVLYEVQYTADENGFHPKADHIPVAPADVPPTF